MRELRLFFLCSMIMCASLAYAQDVPGARPSSSNIEVMVVQDLWSVGMIWITAEDGTLEKVGASLVSVPEIKSRILVG